MMSEPSALTCCRIDPDRYPELIARMGEILREGQSHAAEKFDEAYWRWKYRSLVEEEPRVYGIFEGGRLGGYYHVAVYPGVMRGEARRFAHVQDVAVLRELRGRGTFRQLAEFATADLEASGIDLSYTFPNARSIRTFLKYNGYAEIKTLDTLLMPLDSAGLLRRRGLRALGLDRAIGGAADTVLGLGAAFSSSSNAELKTIRSFAGEVVELFDEFQRSAAIALRRDEAWLNWRFVEKPGAEHLILALEEDSAPIAVAVFKRDEMFGSPALILMDFAFRAGRADALLNLIAQLRRRRAELAPDAEFIFTAGCDPVSKKLPRVGFLPIPARLNPRPLRLLVRNLNLPQEDRALLSDAANWRVTLADWDVF